MALVRRIICAYLCIAITPKVKSDHATPTEDLVDEYYTTIPDESEDYLPQDDKDAQAIVDSDRSEKTIAGIITFRDKQRRFAINRRISTKIDPVSSYKNGKHWDSIRYWISKGYEPNNPGNYTIPFWDICFGLLEDENVVIAGYMQKFFRGLDETWITIGMVLTKDIQKMISTYNVDHFPEDFKADRKEQRHPYENMLRVWVRHNREQIEKEDPNHDAVVKDANILKSEHDSGDWQEKKRDQLELILMKKSIKYSRAVIAEFEKIMGGKSIETIINDSIQSCKLNHDLADAYSSLARYVKNKHKYIAEIMAQYCNDYGSWAIWIMSITVVHPKEWPKIDEVFRKDKGQSLRDFILQRHPDHKLLSEMIAVIIDPTYKPTTFSPILVDDGKGKPPKSPS